jgi:NTP pyrophosphatase (non-canonical NTP hydrolase)
MIDLKEKQKEVYQNKVNHGFNITDLNMEFCLAYGELGEAYMAWLKQKEDLGEELADVAIYLLGIAEILGIDLETEIVNKMEKNKKRVYKKVNGCMVKVEE